MFVIGYALLIASIPLLIAAYFFEKKGNSLSTGAVVCQFLAAVSFVMTPMLYLESMEGNSCSMEIGLGLAFASSLAASLFSFIYAFSKKPMSIHDIAEDAILVAAAFALNFIKIPVGETGGSINLQLLPIYIIALRHGPFQGIISGGIVLGILTCFTDGYGFVSFHYDYLIGLGSAGLLGFFNRQYFCCNFNVCLDHLVYQMFNFLQLYIADLFIMVEIETSVIRAVIGTGLGDMIAENGAERTLQKME
jgi:thiamine transporter ThiT